jgi:hypothetical protein
MQRGSQGLCSVDASRLWPKRHEDKQRRPPVYRQKSLDISLSLVCGLTLLPLVTCPPLGFDNQRSQRTRMYRESITVLPRLVFTRQWYLHHSPHTFHLSSSGLSRLRHRCHAPAPFRQCSCQYLSILLLELCQSLHLSIDRPIPYWEKVSFETL